MQLRKVKSYMMPLSMLIGALFYPFFDKFSFITPGLIFIMLFITYTNISLRDVRFSKLHLWLIALQLLGSILVYGILYQLDIVIAQAVMMCVLAPTATSAVVITGMLGGNTASLTAFSLLSNLMVALVAPIFFTIIGSSDNYSFWNEFLSIFRIVCGLLLVPFILALILKKLCSKLHDKIKSVQSVSFYLWNIALLIVTARSIQFLISEGASHLYSTCLIAFFTLLICLLQFYLGRKVGKFYNDTIAGGQGLGQKNTILTIWMTQTYLNPLASIGPGFYILWQNIVNSLQMWQKRKQD